MIVGYDEYNTWLLDPATGEVKPYGMQDSTKLFKKQEIILLPIWKLRPTDRAHLPENK